MTITEYIKLDAEQQLEIWLEAKLIGRITFNPELEIVCKKIGTFYVEFLKRNSIWIDMRAYESTTFERLYMKVFEEN
jgi:hypothetical protein